MREPSEIDFRSCLLLPPLPAKSGPGAATASVAGGGMQASAAESQMAGMGGGTLGDL